LVNVRVDVLVVDGGLGEDEVQGIAEWVRTRNGKPGTILLAAPRTRSGSYSGEPNWDQVVAKPLAVEEIQRAVERAGTVGQPAADVLIGNVELNRATMELRENGVSVALTPMQLRLLEYLAQRQGSWVSSRELAIELWKRNGDPEATALVRNHVQRLRSKLAALASGRDMVQSWTRKGYRLS